MRLLERSDAGEFGLTEYFVNDDEIPPYAITFTYLGGGRGGRLRRTEGWRWQG
jgi:hypothetical protein